jgi:hypothetical protein
MEPARSHSVTALADALRHLESVDMALQNPIPNHLPIADAELFPPPAGSIGNSWTRSPMMVAFTVKDGVPRTALDHNHHQAPAAQCSMQRKFRSGHSAGRLSDQCPGPS